MVVNGLVLSPKYEKTIFLKINWKYSSRKQSVENLQLPFSRLALKNSWFNFLLEHQNTDIPSPSPQKKKLFYCWMDRIEQTILIDIHYKSNRT